MLHLLFRTGVLLMLTGYLAGCATQDVADPSKISLERALVETEDALIAAHQEASSYVRHGGTYFGLYACSVTAVYNISATAGEDNKLSLSASPAIKIVPITATGSLESTASGTTGNTVTVNLSNPYCSSSKSTGGGQQQQGNKGGGVLMSKKKPPQQQPGQQQQQPNQQQPQPGQNPYPPVMAPRQHPQ
jgi:hypothetical protein